MLIESLLPGHFWVDAAYTATYVINRLPTPFFQGLSPFEKLLSLVEKSQSDAVKIGLTDAVLVCIKWARSRSHLFTNVVLKENRIR